VIILYASTLVSCVLAFLEQGDGLTAVGDLAVVSHPFYIFLARAFGKPADMLSRCFLS